MLQHTFIPSDDDAAPSDDDAAPSDDDAAPSDDGAAPSDDDAAPSHDGAAPSDHDVVLGPSDNDAAHDDYAGSGLDCVKDGADGGDDAYVDGPADDSQPLHYEYYCNGRVHCTLCSNTDSSADISSRTENPIVM
jgi:hypothetical protein